MPTSPTAPTGPVEPGGPTVLVARGGMWGASVAARIAERGLTPWVLPLVETVPAPSPDLARAVAELGDGGYDWLAVSSAAAVPALDGVRIPQATRVAAVGSTTAQALREVGIEVDLVGSGGAQELLAIWPAPRTPGERVLVVRSDLSRTAFADGLRARGHRVDSVIAYRTVPAATSPREEHALREGKADLAFVTSGSVARRLAELGVSPATRLVAMGEQTAQDVRAAGLEVAAVAPEPTVEALVGAAVAVLEEKR